MSTLRLNATSDLNDDYGRAQLQETLELLSNAMRQQQIKLEAVENSERNVRPVPVEAYPIAQGPVQTSAVGGAQVGQAIWLGTASTPGGFLPCDGTVLNAVTNTEYQELYNVIGNSYGGSNNTDFEVPDCRGRSPMGAGTGTSLTARTLGTEYGDEDLVPHDHSVPDHKHGSLKHFHANPHHHEFEGFYNPGTPLTLGPGAAYNALTTYQAQTTVHTTNQKSSGHADDDNTDEGYKWGTSDELLETADKTGLSVNSTGSGSATDKNLHPVVTFHAYMRYTTGGSSSSAQQQSMCWGPVAATWYLSSGSNFPNPSVINTYDTLLTTPVDEAIIQASCDDPGGSASVISDNYIRAVVRLPFNFRRWKARALRIRNKITNADLTPTNWTMSLSVFNPLSLGSVLATKSRQASSDGDYSELVFSAEDMGPNWKAGYPLVFHLYFNHSLDVETFKIHVGRLEIGWA